MYQILEISLPQMLAEGESGGGDHLEVLDSEGNSYDRDAEEKTADEMNCRDFPESAEDPDNVHRHRQAAGLILAELHLAAEGPHNVGAKFEQLHSERNTDNGYAHQQTDQIVEESDLQSSEDQP